MTNTESACRGEQRPDGTPGASARPRRAPCVRRQPPFVAASIASLCVAFGAQGATPPAGFEDHPLVDTSATTGAVSPVGIAYEPGSGALFVLEKGDGTRGGTARVRRRDATTGAVTTALTVGCVDSGGERGLLGIAFDPSYTTAGGADRWVYLFYTRYVPNTGACAVTGISDGEYNWISRFRESGGTLSQEQVLLRGAILGADNHNGGTLRFLPDGMLLISMGDNDSDAFALPYARDLNDLRGKMLRIRRDGTVPSDNPFYGQAGKRPEVWAWGLRNPFRFSVDPANGTTYIGDVGEQTWEEIDRGIAGADYGWPCLEGPSPYLSCNPPAGSPVAPLYAYGHQGQTWPIQGNSITMGPVYRATAFPPEYRGNLYFGDYAHDWIRRARIALDGTLTDITMFTPDADGVVDMAVSPAGCLAWVSIVGQGVRETCYAGGVNAQPQADSVAAPMSGLAPLTIQFDGSGSSDPDQDPLTYAWAFGDSTTSSAPAPMETFTVNGVYQAVLTVDDGTGATNATDAAPPLRFVVGNRSPVGAIASPAPGARYDAGATVGFAGSGSDPEDGTLPASRFSWTVVFHHGGHTHPFLGPVVGTTSGSFVVPTNGEESTDVFYRTTLTVTDSGAPLGSTGTVSQASSVDILPNLTTVTVAAAPAGAGLALAIDQSPSAAPWSKATVVGFTRTLTAPSSQTVRGATWTFVSWSDGGAADHTVVPPLAPATYTATYQCVSGCDFTPTLGVARVAPDTARLQWASLACAISYDVVRGGLTTLRSTAGAFAPATTACVANETVVTTLDDPTTAPAGGLWFLLRGNGCGGFGSYDEAGIPSQSGARTAEIAASANACP